MIIGLIALITVITLWPISDGQPAHHYKRRRRF